jgi:hypothetical protein
MGRSEAAVLLSVDLSPLKNLRFLWDSSGLCGSF